MKTLRAAAIIFVVLTICLWQLGVTVAHSMTLEDKQYYLEVSYAKKSGNYLIVGLSAKYTGRVQCLALDEYGNVVSMATTYIHNENEELYIPRASEATNVSCKYVK